MMEIQLEEKADNEMDLGCMLGHYHGPRFLR